MLSPVGILYSLRALAERPFRHRRHSELEASPSPPPDVWWAQDDRWYAADTPPRRGNRLEPLIDGHQALGAMYDAMDSATESIYLASWYLSPGFRLVRPGYAGERADPEIDDPSYSFLALVARKAAEVDVRILLWPGSLSGKCRRRHVKETCRVLREASPRLRVRVDRHERLSHCQHQKALVVDGRVAFVGGLDPTEFDADRWDTRDHAYRQGRNWHDADWRLEGPCVADVAANFVERWNAVAPRDPISPPLAPDPFPDGVAVQVQRTIPRGVYSFAPDGFFGIAHAYARAIVRARRFIYLESQYLWSPEITDALCDAIRRGATTGLHVALVLPAHPNIGKGDTDRHVRELLDADEGRGIIRVYTLYTSEWSATHERYRYRPVYVHAKIAVIDDEWATVGSANLNGRGMATDAELNASVVDAGTARALRLRLWCEHLACSEDDLRDADPAALLRDMWPARAAEQAERADRHGGLLTAAIFPYPLGDVDADFAPGEVESAILDR